MIFQNIRSIQNVYKLIKFKNNIDVTGNFNYNKFVVSGNHRL